MKIVEGDEAVADWLEEKLLNTLKNTNTQAENSNLVLAAKTPEDQIVGGLVASTSYGWLLIKILWVDSHHRGSGMGRSLMKHAEQCAMTRHCHSAWLDTSNADAYKFYVSIGYETFGELSNDHGQIPSGHHRWFMKKSLQS